MSLPHPAQPAKLVVSAILKDLFLLEAVTADLVSAFGPIDLISPWYAFDFTEYYTHEMGSPLYRRVLSFQTLIGQEHLPEIKLRTNDLEKARLVQASRQVNLDPGYLVLERFVLATGKNFSHRIYLGQGIYADLTLIFQKDAFQTLPWTYPDYASPQLGEFLLQVRQKYSRDLSDLKTPVAT